MKKSILFLSLGIFLISCDEHNQQRIKKEDSEFKSHKERNLSAEADSLMSSLKSPVILIGKDKTFDMWGITVKDSSGKIYTFGDLLSISNNIGASRNIGDTIK